jgi:hypothetical protein
MFNIELSLLIPLVAIVVIALCDPLGLLAKRAFPWHVYPQISRISLDSIRIEKTSQISSVNGVLFFGFCCRHQLIAANKDKK